ncbi:tubulin binding [Moniliophthora roreri MCA 2997]|uniref:Tubulin binding n=1 Tax=Moniliophthora roreri (strain MCA 2997) TaxID=1381753 RepID=V2WHN3_MONRO|nr:tubulin binding [Moniliophthora roreri MCA 2997]
MAILDPVQLSSASDMKSQLQTLLDEKEKQLQQAGTLGQRVLAQQMELEERIRQLQQVIGDADSTEGGYESGGEGTVGKEAKEKFQELAETLVQWDRENAVLSSAFGKSSSSSPSMAVAELPREESVGERSKASTSAAAQSRRAKNAAHRADDVEFAFEIGSGLLNEVRRLQSLLGERDKAIQDMKEERDDLEASVEGLRTALKQQEQSADKFKEENWNLEVTLQDLRTQLTNSLAHSAKLEGDTKRLTKSLATTRDAHETAKSDLAATQASLEALQAKHETDVALARKHAAGLQRDKSDLQATVERLKNDVERATRRPGFGAGRFGNTSGQSPGTLGLNADGMPNDFLTPGGPDADSVFTGSTNTRRGKIGYGYTLGDEFDLDVDADSPDASPLPGGASPFMAPSHPRNEIETLQQRLAHAQRQLQTLQGTVRREKREKMELRRKMGMSELDDDNEWVEGEEEEEEEEEQTFPAPTGRKPARQHVGTPYRRGGAIRGRMPRRGGLTLNERLSLVSSQGDDDEYTQFGERRTSMSPERPEDEYEGEDQVPDMTHASPSQAQSNRNSVASVTSIEGMDPAFANVLKRTPSTSSVGRGSPSPLRHSLLRRSTRGRGRPLSGSVSSGSRRRGMGLSVGGGRPPSIADAPEDLGRALGDITGSAGNSTAMGIMAELGMDQYEVEVEVETAEMGCQTDDVEPEVREVVKEVPVEVPVEVVKEIPVEVIKEVVKEVPVEVVKEVKVPVEVPVEVVKEVVKEVPVEVIKEVIKEVPVEVVREVEVVKEVKVPVEVVKEVQVPVEVVKEVPAEQSAAARELVNSGVQHEVVAERILDTKNVGTDVLRMVEVEIQTKPMGPSSPAMPIDSERTRKTTITQRDISANSLGSIGETTLRAPAGRAMASSMGSAFGARAFQEDSDTDYDDGATETGQETETDGETDTDDYQDARASIMASTPSGSRDDFHSILTVTDNEGSADEWDDDDDMDAESLRTSKVSQSVASQSRSSFYATPSGSAAAVGIISASIGKPPVTYESKGVEAVIIEEPPARVEAATSTPEAQPLSETPPKPEVREISVQTDALPATPPRTISGLPTTSQSPVMYRVGAGGTATTSSQLFQFVPPAAPSASTNKTNGAVSAGTTGLLPSPVASLFKESAGGFATIFPRRSMDDHRRRPSIESAVSSAADDVASAGARSRVSSANNNGAQSVVDKTRPPMMTLPPPPRAPPPPGSMPPPNFIPERRLPANSTGSYDRDIPPPRPSSPPPPELIQRATTPTFGSVLSVPGGSSRFGSVRGHGSLPPQGLRQPPSTSSFRSAANATGYGHATIHVGKETSTASLVVSDRSGLASPRSSMSSDHNPYLSRNPSMGSRPDAATSNKGGALGDMMGMSRPQGNNPTDPAIIHAITQTMIGEFLYKYTRKTIGKGHGTARHKRFFWVHPYTKTLYWSSADPNSTNVTESSAKSAYIEGVRSVLDPNPMPPGLYQYSVVVSTPQREMKFTAPTKERHDIWLNSLKYLLARPNPANITSPGNATVVPESPVSDHEYLSDDQHLAVNSSPQSQRSRRITRNENSFNTTPRGKRSRSQLSVGRGSIGRRSGTPAAEYLKWNGPESPYSPTRSFVDVAGNDDDDDNLDFELHGDSLSDEGGFEGLENVRACCDGRHTVGRAGGKHHHHHHHHHHDGPGPGSQNGDHIAPARPVSPSAWSFRSSTPSHEGGGSSLFPWGRGEDGKLRFGSRRSAKTAVSSS